jgi:hemerythrin
MSNKAKKKSDVYERIRREHEELRVVLGNLHQTLVQRAESVQDVARKVNSVCDHVEEHFREEEEGGFFDQISRQAPRLSDRSLEVRDQHVGLLERIREIRQLAREGNGSDEWWQRLGKEFHDFATELMHHETKESELLQDAYTDDIGSQD